VNITPVSRAARFAGGPPTTQEFPMSHRLIACAATCMLVFGFAFGATAQEASSTPAPADGTFMKHAAADGLAEIQMGKLALQKSSSEDVKKFASRIVADHTKANEDLKTVAQAHQVILPAAPGEEAQHMAATLQARDGASFDAAWANAMVQDHQKAVASFSTAAGDADAADVKAFAKRTLPTLEAHLELARQLQSNLGAGTAGNGE
jgi:putative membrane protein